MNSEIVVFPFLNNWIQDVKLKYNYITAISENKIFVEQRRSLKNLVLREQDLTFTKESAEKNLLLNALLYAKDKRIALPIYLELFFTSTSPLLGESTLVIVEDISEYWNLWNQCTHILIIQEYNVYELIEKNYATSNSIILESAVTVNFTGDVEIYPVMFCNLKDIKPNYVNSKVYTLDLSFQEIRTYQHNETEEDAQQDYFLYNYSKNDPATEVITAPEITTNGDITITPGEPVPTEIVIIIVTSTDIAGNTIRTQEKTLDENGIIIITKVGDEKGIKIGYKWTNKESIIVYFYSPPWYVNTSALTTFEELENRDDGVTVEFNTTTPKIPLDSVMDVELWNYDFTTKHGQLIRSAPYTPYNRRNPQKWNINAYRNHGLLPKDFYLPDYLMGYSSNSGYYNSSDNYPGSGTYPPPGQICWNGTDIQFKAREYKTGRYTDEAPGEWLNYVQSGYTLAQFAPNLGFATTYNDSLLKVYSTNTGNKGIFQADWVGWFYWGWPFYNQNTSLCKFRKEGGGYCTLPGTWIDEDCGAVLFPRRTSEWGCLHNYTTEDRVLAIVLVATYEGVEFWSNRAVCHYQYHTGVIIHDSYSG